MKRRRVDIHRFADVIADVHKLESSGYQPVGHWDLPQICDHLAFAMESSIDGFPTRAPWIVRRFLGPRYFRKIRETRRLRTGVKIPEKFLPKKGTDATLAIHRLENAVARFERHTGRVDEHPILGRFTYEDWQDFHLIHAAHHLSFLQQTSSLQGDTLAAAEPLR